MSNVITTVSIKHPDVRPRTIRRYTRIAIDAGLQLIPDEFLQFHFKRSAVSRYGGEYAKISDKLRKRPTKRPLVKTGMLRAAALNAQPRFVGAADRRKMRLPGMPKYVYYNKPGTFHKVRAMQQINPDEHNQIVGTMRQTLQQQISKGNKHG